MYPFSTPWKNLFSMGLRKGALETSGLNCACTFNKHLKFSFIRSKVIPGYAFENSIIYFYQFFNPQSRIDNRWLNILAWHFVDLIFCVVDIRDYDTIFKPFHWEQCCSWWRTCQIDWTFLHVSSFISWSCDNFGGYCKVQVQHTSQMYLKPGKKFINEIFCKNGYGFKAVNYCRNENSIINLWLGSKYTSALTGICTHCTKMKLSIKDFFSKCDQIRMKLWIWSHLLKKSLMENFIFCAVTIKNKVHFFWKSKVDFSNWKDGHFVIKIKLKLKFKIVVFTSTAFNRYFSR